MALRKICYGIAVAGAMGGAVVVGVGCVAIATVCYLEYKVYGPSRNIDYIGAMTNLSSNDINNITKAFYQSEFPTSHHKINKPNFEDIENVYKSMFTDTLESIKEKKELDQEIKNHLDNKITEKYLIIYSKNSIFKIEFLENVDNNNVLEIGLNQVTTPIEVDFSD
jgi:hypothetical protein